MPDVNTEVSPAAGTPERIEELDLTADLEANPAELIAEIPVELTPPPTPIFVDASGRRRRLLKPLGIPAALLCCAYLAAVGVSLVVGSNTPLTPWTDIATGHDGHTAGHVRPTGAGGSRKAIVPAAASSRPGPASSGPSAGPQSSPSPKARTSPSAGTTPATATTSPAATGTATASASPTVTATTTHGKGHKHKKAA